MKSNLEDLISSKSKFKILLTDSRNLSYAKDTIFFAIKSASGNGHLFISELYKQGVRNFVVSEYDNNWPIDATYYVVNDSIEALQKLASKHRCEYNIPVIGITGSNGKTIVKEWIYQMLSDKYSICRSPKSYNSQIGVPLSVWNLNNSHNLAIFEAGISLPGEMSKLQDIIRPTIGIFTNLGTAHQEGFSSEKEKLKEKAILFKDTNIVIARKKYRLSEFFSADKLIEWELGENVFVNRENGCTSIQINEKKYNIPFNDDASIENIVNAVLAAETLGTNVSTDKLEPIGMRLELCQGLNNSLLINDCYNSDIDSLSIALDFLVYNAENKFDKKTLILSDISQSGKYDKDLYQTVSSLIKQKGINRLIGVGKKISEYSYLFNCDKQMFDSTQELTDSNIRFDNEIILVKGARSFHLEDMVTKLAQRRHETVMEINLNALVHNFKKLRSYIKHNTKTVAMIKANAYGCGAIEVAQTLSHHNCEYFGVAVADEGVELRKAGIKTKIIVMDPEPGTFDLLINYNLEPEIYSFRMLDFFAKYADKQGVKDHPIHIKIDTGMHRLGFNPEDMPKLVESLKHNTSVKASSVFSHLAAAEDESMDDFTLSQINRFKQATDYLKQNLDNNIIRHILNTSGTQRPCFADYQFEMVRMGIGLYGVGLNEHSDIQNIATLKSIILQIKELSADETVGYNRKGRLTRKTRVAAIPIGYADGLNRAFGNRNGYVLINGKKAPFLGNICMDVCMVDITDIENVNEGDEVIIFGNNLTISELASKTSTIPYEILTSISLRVKRVYYQE